MRLFVTGGAGLVGSHDARSVLTGAYPGFEDSSVTAVDRLTYARSAADPPR
jgi:dTDP-glucose 4,6-dehydratase